ncbi:hypothetical protein NHF50_06125 [Flavobacterium sp. NRK F10]|uniref:Transcriptional regulator n=1 Tax=Flavobacterium sediminis TaxID=2201181 RepID=A0A2U8QUH3_9FLAO|nr:MULTISPECIES: hypothetical protein [Flavobacterium]AWM13504.1 hypothetical protein DI487_06270 [Flavobacterium sediminis]MCO6174616.1 hypothetical protein [Flavobacterium sp. NRK F10]
MDNNAEKEKEELIEMFGVHFEKFHMLPPLAARILATLILNSREKDLSFEDLVCITGASKSSVSTNINLLLKLEKIIYYTICGDRKKFFKPASLADRIKNHLVFIKSEQNIIKRISSYEEKYKRKPLTVMEEKSLEIYREYVNNFEVLLQDSIKKIEELETK